uniref:Uncharacterized protein n=1 Tax=Sphaerodactylus townsendi TaxID=933632 RepID=A0ACB8EK99_9SAUR
MDVSDVESHQADRVDPMKSVRMMRECDLVCETRRVMGNNNYKEEIWKCLTVESGTLSDETEETKWWNDEKNDWVMRYPDGDVGPNGCWTMRKWEKHGTNSNSYNATRTVEKVGSTDRSTVKDPRVEDGNHWSLVVTVGEQPKVVVESSQ